MAATNLGATVLAARLKNRRLPAVQVPNLKEAELNRTLEGMQEHLRMYEGNSAAPKERFVTLSELENSGLLTADVKNKFAFISQVLGAEVSQPADQPTSTTIINNITQGGGGGGVDNLTDLTDTSVASRANNDFLQYNSGEWRDFDLYGSDILITGTWTYDAPIHWLDANDLSRQMLNLQTFGGTLVPGDPDFGFVVLLLPLDGDDEATSAVDLSNENHTPTFQGNAQIDTAQSKWGDSSLLLDGTGDYLTIPSATSLSIAASDVGDKQSFIVEMDVRFNGDPGAGSMCFAAKWTEAGNQREWYFGLRNNELVTFISSNGSNGIPVNDAAWNPVADTWYTVTWEIDSKDFTGNTSSVYVDGVLLQSGSISSWPTIYNGAAACRIGAYGTTPFDYLNGWIDNVRITKNKSRYEDTSFTPPTGPYATTASGGIVGEENQFDVGNPAFPTHIDGLATNISSATTSLDGTLNVALDAVFGGTLTISNGTDTGAFSHDGTDFNTTFIGTTDWNVAGLTGNVILDDGVGLQFVEPAGSGEAVTFSHDGNDLVTDFKLFTGWNLNLITALRLDNTRDCGIVIDADTDNTNNFDNPYIQFKKDSVTLDVTNIGTVGSDSVDSVTETCEDVPDESFVIHNLLPNGSIAFGIAEQAWLTIESTGPSAGSTTAKTQLHHGCTFEMYSVDENDSVIFDHDGTDFNTAFTGTTDWNITGLTTINLTGAYKVADAAGPTVVNEAATATNPTLIPNVVDLDTGLGWASADQLTAVAGGVEAIKYSEASGHILVDSEVDTGITAGTTQTQAGGFQLLSSHNEVATVANTNDTVVAPLAVAGRAITILNNGANTMQIFPAVGDDIGAGVDTVITLAAGGKVMFLAYDATTWTQFV